jgi:hypothetical protein
MGFSELIKLKQEGKLEQIGKEEKGVDFQLNGRRPC